VVPEPVAEPVATPPVDVPDAVETVAALKLTAKAAETGNEEMKEVAAEMVPAV